MNVFYDAIALLWVLLLSYWTIAFFWTKRTVRYGMGWRREILWRLLVAVPIIVAIKVPTIRDFVVRYGLASMNTDPVLGGIGTAVCAAGVGFAIWSRNHLGRNWGVPMSKKENPELVTTGPYAWVRHPIYSGFLLAMLGSAVGLSPVWFLPLIVMGGVFTYAARREEREMLNQFPQAYLAYMQRTSRLVPFVY